MRANVVVATKRKPEAKMYMGAAETVGLGHLFKP